MLVIHEFTVSEETILPITMDFRVPSDANITAVAYTAADGLLLADYQTKDSQDSNWQTITLFIAEPTAYRVEYYQPLARSSNDRSFNYQWSGDYAVNTFDIELRIPIDSANVKTTPTIPLTQQQPFLSGGAQTNGLKEGQTYRLQLDYSRTNDSLIATPDSSQVEPLVPINENTDGRSTLDNLPLFLGGFGVLLLAAGAFYYLRGQSNGNTTGKSRKRSGRSSAEGNSQTYCHECGARAHEGDRFCRTCGNKLRH